MMTREAFHCMPYDIASRQDWTAREWHAYVLAWTWCAPRFGGDANRRQERCFDRLGFDELLRRRERARKLAERFGATLPEAR